MDKDAASTSAPKEITPGGLSEDDDLLAQIARIDEMIEQSKVDMKSKQERVDQVDKEIVEEKLHIVGLQKKSEELKATLRMIVWARNNIHKDISSMRSFLTQIIEILMPCEKDMESIKEINVIAFLKQYEQNCKKTIACMSTQLTDIEKQVIQISKDNKKNDDINASSLASFDKEIMQLKEKVHYNKKEYEAYCDSINVVTEKNKCLLRKISELNTILNNNNNELHTIKQQQVECKAEIDKGREHLNFLVNQGRQTLQNLKDKISMNRECLNNLLFSKESATKCNEELKQKIYEEERRKIILQNEIANLKHDFNDLLKQYETNETDLSRKIENEKNELYNIQTSHTTESQHISELNKVILDFCSKIEGTAAKISKEESSVKQLEEIKNENLKNMEDKKQQCMMYTAEYQNLSQVLDKLTSCFEVNEEQERNENIKINVNITNINTQIDKMLNQEIESKKTIIGEMDSMEQEYNIKNFNIKNDFEERSKSIKNNIELIQKEYNEKCVKAVELEEQLKKQQHLHQEVLNKICALEDVQKYLVEVDNMDDGFTKPHEAVKRPAEHGDCSDSSEDSSHITLKQLQKIKELQRKREERRKFRDKKKEQKKQLKE
ncbi:hypothetical protein FQA39_LY01724 [Lamprigera yunnana]|nr:hypothetical protein FQA39_LY01724 [Lamprigera yunnana]